MEWDHITEGWKRFVTKIVTPRNATWARDSETRNFFDVADFDDERYNLQPPAPYTPDWSRKRNESSLHLSC